MPYSDTWLLHIYAQYTSAYLLIVLNSWTRNSSSPKRAQSVINIFKLFRLYRFLWFSLCIELDSCQCDRYIITIAFCLSRASEGRNPALSTSRWPFFLLLPVTNHRILHANYFLWKTLWCSDPIFQQSEHAEKHARKSSCKLKFDMKNFREFHRVTECTSSPPLVSKT